MSMKQRILGCLKGAQPLPALFALLAEAEPTQQTPIKETILRLFEAEHDWTNVQTHLKQWGGLVGWANDFLQRMYVRIGEPSFGRILTEPEQIDAELARVANLYWANVSERKPRAEAERLQRGPKPTPADVDFVFAAAKQDSGRSIEHELRKHSFAATGSAELYQPTKVHMTSKSKIAVKDSANFLDSLPQMPQIVPLVQQQKSRQIKEQNRNGKLFQVSKSMPCQMNQLSFSDSPSKFCCKLYQPNEVQTNKCQSVPQEASNLPISFNFISMKKTQQTGPKFQNVNQLFTPQTAALINKDRFERSNFILEELTKQNQISIVNIAINKMRNKLMERKE